MATKAKAKSKTVVKKATKPKQTHVWVVIEQDGDFDYWHSEIYESEEDAQSNAVDDSIILKVAVKPRPAKKKIPVIEVK